MSEKPVIAVDVDDVLSQTNQAVADWHNSHYGTNMVLDDFHYYHYWKNPDWGTPTEVHNKVKIYYATSIMTPKPVLGALEGVQALRDMGFKLVIITARHAEEQKLTQKWLDQYYPDAFDDLVCTGQFLKDEDGIEVHFKVGKAEVCHRLKARLLIDDSVENALACARDATPQIPVLLFGDYSWNKRESRLEHPQDHLGFKERLNFEHGREWWKDENVNNVLPENVSRVKDWKAVIAYVERHKAEGLI
ncbi:hypothetical protein DFH11DRAFT_1560172 [Phellopilus nigrolimitatus]|nr:hypothetical protein DFH11DRAFT_1560172 [Phellopilus nigrolimitatus]